MYCNPTSVSLCLKLLLFERVLTMNFDQLRYISYLTQVNSLTKVADHFFTSHQVVRNAITNLEAELDTPLLISTNQGTELTPAGKCVADFVPKFETLYQELQTSLQDFKLPTHNQPLPISLYITPAMSNDCYLSLFNTYSLHHPEIKLTLRFSLFPQVLEQINSEEISIFLTVSSNQPKMKTQIKFLAKQHGLRAIFFNESSPYICLHKSSKYAKVNNLAFDDFKNESVYVFMYSNPFLTNDPNSSKHQTFQYFSDFHTIKSILKNNAGIVFLRPIEYHYYFTGNNSDFVLKMLKGESFCHVILISEKTLDYNAALQNFLQFLRNEICVTK